MRVAQVISSMGQESSGVQAYVGGLCEALSANGMDTTLYTCGPVRNIKRPYKLKTYPRTRFPFYSIGRSPGLKNALRKEVARYDIVHSNALWMMPNIYPAWAININVACQAKLVTMPHGSLAPWALSLGRIKKCFFSAMWQKRALDRSAMFVATCEKEYGEIRRYGQRQPVAIIPIGIMIPNGIEKGSDWRLPNRKRRALFLGRLHKVKAIDNLVEAWYRLCNADYRSIGGAVRRDWELVVAGPDGGMREELEKFVRIRHLANVTFLGEVNGDDKYRLFASSDICVLPSHTENFGLTVAESLACGTPVIASQGTPWSGLNAEKAGLWIPIGVEPLANALYEMISMDADMRARMGANGKAWMVRDFSWAAVVAKMKSAYEWLLDPQSRDRPDYVRID